MKAEDFVKTVYEKSKEDYGICPPPTDAQFGLNILIKHFLGKDWYTSMPVGQEQVNTEAIYQILKKYPEKTSKNIFRKLELLWKKKFSHNM